MTRDEIEQTLGTILAGVRAGWSVDTINDKLQVLYPGPADSLQQIAALPPKVAKMQARLQEYEANKDRGQRMDDARWQGLEQRITNLEKATSLLSEIPAANQKTAERLTQCKTSIAAVDAYQNSERMRLNVHIGQFKALKKTVADLEQQLPAGKQPDMTAAERQIAALSKQVGSLQKTLSTVQHELDRLRHKPRNRWTKTSLSLRNGHTPVPQE